MPCSNYWLCHWKQSLTVAVFLAVFVTLLRQENDGRVDFGKRKPLRWKKTVIPRCCCAAAALRCTVVISSTWLPRWPQSPWCRSARPRSRLWAMEPLSGICVSRMSQLKMLKQSVWNQRTSWVCSRAWSGKEDAGGNLFFHLILIWFLSRSLSTDYVKKIRSALDLTRFFRHSTAQDHIPVSIPGQATAAGFCLMMLLASFGHAKQILQFCEKKQTHCIN